MNRDITLRCDLISYLNNVGEHPLTSNSNSCICFIIFELNAISVSYKELVKARCTVGLPTLLLEDAVMELPQTEGANKVLRMKSAIKS